jgi:hypothetical protein
VVISSPFRASLSQAVPWVLIDSPYYVITVARETGFVHALRSDAPFPTVEEYDLQIAQVAAALLRIDRPSYVLLIDVRKAPSRNDPSFEQANLRFRSVVVHGFRRMAVLVASQAGKLHIERHARELGSGPAVFLDERAALAYLDEPRRPEGRPPFDAGSYVTTRTTVPPGAERPSRAPERPRESGVRFRR